MPKIEIIECPKCGELCKGMEGLKHHITGQKDHPSVSEFFKIDYNEVEPVMDYIIPITNMDDDGFKYRLNNLNIVLRLIPKMVNVVIVEQMLKPVNKLYTKNIDIPKDISITKKVVKYPIFNKPWLYNIGVKLSKTNNILLAEGDININRRYFIQIKKFIEKSDKKWFFGWNRIKYWNENADKVIRDDTPRIGMAEGGIVYFNKNFYWDIGGANEFIQELGGIDNELIRRASYISKTYDMFKWTINHMWHPISKVKENKWKDGKYRPNNVKIYYYTKANPGKMIGILINEKQGNISKPLCSHKTLEFLK